MALLKDFWASTYFNNPDYYQDSFLYFNTPLYILIWLGAVYFSGGYDRPISIRRLARGLLLGTFFLAAVYGFLDLVYRPSRALIILGSIWAFFSTTAIRLLLHFVQHGNFNLDRVKAQNLVIVGSKKESSRVESLLHQAGVSQNFIGTVAPNGILDSQIYLSNLEQLDEVVNIYKVDEIVFCSKDIRAQDIMQWMTRLGPQLEYKIVPKESLSIIGSSSKNTAGELYTVDIRFQIADPIAKRNKRMLDLLLSIALLILFPIVCLFVQEKAGFLRNIFQVIGGHKSWVGYIPSAKTLGNLPAIRPGVLHPLDALASPKVNEPTRQRLNFFYAKDYQVGNDLDILWKGFTQLGRS